MDGQSVTLTGIVEKAVAQAATGDLEIEGWVARFDEPDRQGEFFMPGAFDRAIETVKQGNVPLLYQHADGQQLGQVVELEKKAGGVWGRAVVPKPTAEWAADVFDKLKRGMCRGLSAKGMFTKQLLAGGGARIGDVDLFEVSATPVPVGAGATIETVAQKALSAEDNDGDLEMIDRYFTERFDELAAVMERLGPE